MTSTFLKYCLYSILPDETKYQLLLHYQNLTTQPFLPCNQDVTTIPMSTKFNLPSAAGYFLFETPVLRLNMQCLGTA